MPDKVRYLTKSRFKKALECPGKLYYYGKDKYPSNFDDNDFMMALAEGGFQVGELAKYYYPGGHDIKALDYERSLQMTGELLKQENVIIYEAAVLFEKFFIRIDVLKKTGNRIELIEVKAKSFNREKDSFLNKGGYIDKGWLPYLQDAAFQTWVTQNAFPDFKVIPHLMLADKSQRASVDGLNQRFKIFKNDKGRTAVKITGDVSLPALGHPLLSAIPIQEYVNMIFDGSDIPDNKKDKETRKKFTTRAYEYAAYYERDEQYPVSIGAKCKKCEYRVSDDKLTGDKLSGFKQCWQKQLGWKDEDFDKPHIFDIWNFRAAEKLMADNIYFMEDIIIEEVLMKSKKDGSLIFKSAVSQRQNLQIEKTLSREKTEGIDENLFFEMSMWKFPLHFIDFETSMTAIPFNKGRRPYEQIAFQFSCHTINEDGTWTHDEWIAKEAGKFPNYDFLRALKNILDKDNGTIFRYAAHENSVLRQIQRQIIDDIYGRPDNSDELIEWIDTITQWKEDVIENGKKKKITHKGERNMVDMLELVRNYYYHPSMGGSNSIKAVLPAVLQSSKFLEEKYSKPYNSQNYTDWIWRRLNEETGRPYDPYKLLPPLFDDADISAENMIMEGEHIKDGGAAMTAYAKMQFTEMSNTERKAILSGLLKYCELDTLAMVMIWEHWKSRGEL